MDAIEERLTVLERQLRQARLLLLCLLAALMCSMLVGATYADNRIEKENFVVVDEDGQTRAILGMFSGEPALMLYGEGGGTPLAIVRVQETKAAIVLQSPSGTETWRVP